MTSELARWFSIWSLNRLNQKWLRREGGIRKKWGILFVAIFSGIMGVPAAAGNGPHIEFTEPDFDFGSIYQQESVTHEFALRNSGDQDLVIKKVSSSCGCTVAAPSNREIAPGKTGTIKVTFNSGSMRDKVTKHIYVESNDAAQPRAKLTITGTVKREVDVTPYGIFLRNVAIGETVEREVLIQPVEAKTFRILEVKSNNQAVHVGDPERIDDKRGGYRLRIRFGPASQTGWTTATLTVRTDLKHTKEVRITVYGRVGQPVAATPAPASH